MKTAIGLVLVAALALSVAPAVASDTFHALGTLPPAEQANLTPLSDEQLGTIEGGYDIDIAYSDINVALQSQYSNVRQSNYASYSNYFTQTNAAAVYQSQSVLQQSPVLVP
jgi:hypothetical protein